MHPLIIASWYPSNANPTEGIFFEEQAKIFRDAGHKVGVIALNQNSPSILSSIIKPIAVEEKETLWVARVFEIHPRLEQITVLKYWQMRLLRKTLRKYISQYGKPDILHAQSLLFAAPYIADLSSYFSIPWVYTEHFSGFLKGIPANRRMVSNRLSTIQSVIGTCTGGAAVGSVLADAVRDAVDSPPVRVIPNAINTEFFKENKTNATKNHKQFTFCSISNFTPNKNTTGLVRAFAVAFQAEQNVQLLLGGDGPEISKVSTLIQECGLANQVRLLGKLSREGIRDLYHMSNILVSSSYVETFGVTLIEAMACGMPVIATRSGGPDGFMTPEVGILIERDDHDALVCGLRDLRDRYEEYDLMEIRNYAVKHFGPQALVQNLILFYTDAIDVYHQRFQEAHGAI